MRIFLLQESFSPNKNKAEETQISSNDQRKKKRVKTICFCFATEISSHLVTQCHKLLTFLYSSFCGLFVVMECQKKKRRTQLVTFFFAHSGKLNDFHLVVRKLSCCFFLGLWFGQGTKGKKEREKRKRKKCFSCCGSIFCFLFPLLCVLFSKAQNHSIRTRKKPVWNSRKQDKKKNDGNKMPKPIASSQNSVPDQLLSSVFVRVRPCSVSDNQHKLFQVSD